MKSIVIALTTCSIFVCFAARAESTSPAPTTPAHAPDPRPVEQRIAARAAKVVEKVGVRDATAAKVVQDAVGQFYTDLNRLHSDRDTKLAALPRSEPKQIDRIFFESNKDISAIFGAFIGRLTMVLAADKISAVKDAMTFDMVPLSMASYTRMFPAMTPRQKAQIELWLTETRETAMTAGSAETKLDAFRVNKLRMHAFLLAQGFDVDAAVAAEEARKAAEKKD